MTAPRASAAQRTWLPSNGAFGLGFFWAEGVSPGPSDTALFDTGQTAYSVGFSLGDAATSQLAVLDAHPQFSLSGHTYVVSDSTSVGYNPGELGQLDLVGPGTLNGGYMTLGQFARSEGRVTLNSSALLKASTLNLGSSGDGSLTVNSGARVEAGFIGLGGAYGSTGSLVVSGANATADASIVTIGLGGAGVATASGGAVVTSGAGPEQDTTLGYNSGADGLLSVIGTGTQWNTRLLRVGLSGRGEVDIDNGARVSGGILSIAQDATARGVVTVRGAGSSLVVTNATQGAGYAEVNIEAGATATLSGGATGKYQIPNTNLNGGTLTVTNLATPIHFNAGTLQVTGSTGLAIGTAAVTGQSAVNADFAVPATGTLQVSGQLNVGANRRLSVGGGGTIEVGAAATDVSANAGTLDVIRGTLLAHNAFVNQAGGTLTVVGSNLVTFQAGLQNSGSVTLAGVGVAGAVANAATGTIYVADTATFGGKVTNNGTIAAAGSVSFNGGLTNNGAINVTGTQNAASPSSASFVTTGGVDGAGSLTVGAGAAAATAYVKQQSLHVTDRGGLYLLASATPTARVVKSVQIDAGGKIDLADNSLIVDYNAGASPLPAVRAAVLAKSITSSALTSRSAIGYAEATDVPVTSRQGADDGAVIVRQTLAGDANLDGAVDFNDLVRLAQSYNTQVSTATDSWWAHGDFTGDGVNDFNDLVKLAQNYNTSLGAATAIPGATVAFESDLGRAFASVPEPSFAGIAGVATLCGLSVRRRRGRSLM